MQSIEQDARRPILIIHAHIIAIRLAIVGHIDIASTHGFTRVHDDFGSVFFRFLSMYFETKFVVFAVL